MRAAPYSILVRGIEADVLPTCQHYGMGVIPWSPLAGGWLTGRYRKGRADPRVAPGDADPAALRRRPAGNQAKLEAADALAGVAEEAGLSLIHLALGFVLAHPAVTSAIIGPRTMDQLKGQLDAGDVVLDDAVLDRIDAIVPPGTTLNPATGADPAGPGAPVGAAPSPRGPLDRRFRRVGDERLEPGSHPGRQAVGAAGRGPHEQTGLSRRRHDPAPRGDLRAHRR